MGREILRLEQRERLLLSEIHEAEDVLAEALNYEWDEDFGFATGDHTLVTLAMEVNRKMREIRELLRADYP